MVSPALRNTLLSALAYAALSVAWTWPWILDPLGTDLSLQMDAPNTLGMGAAAASAEGFRAWFLAWPTGQSLVRGDSFVYFALARLLAGAPPTLPVALLVLLGPPLSALAAERLARRLGAEAPWTLLAGFAYGYSGLAATAVLEGYAFNLFNPWLPLMAVAALDALGPQGTVRQALATVAWWALALATTAYAGIAASLLLVAIGVGGLLRREVQPRPAATLLVTLLGLGGAYVALFLSLPQADRRALPDLETTAGMMASGSATLASLLWRTPLLEQGAHSQGALLASTALVLALYAPVALPAPRPRGLRRLLAAALLLAAASLGPRLRLHVADSGLPWVLAPLAELGLGAWLRFPERLLGPVSLVLGAAGAATLTAIAARRPAWGAALVAAALVDVLVGAGLGLRAGHQPWSVPSAYRAAPQGRAVLDLWPRFDGPGTDTELRLSRRMVGYAALDGHAVLTDALRVSPAEDRRRPIADWVVHQALVAGRREEARARLQDMGIGAVALHASLYQPGASDRIEHAMTRLLGPPAARSTDAGEVVVLWSLPDDSPVPPVADRVATWQRTRAEIR